MNCEVSIGSATKCSKCGADSTEIHSAGGMFTKRDYCPFCCPLHGAQRAAEARNAALAAKQPPPVDRPASQWKDLGFGPDRESDPFYRDTELDRMERSTGPRVDDRWVPRVPRDWLTPARKRW